MTFYELNVGASQTEMKRNLLGCNLHKIANKYLPPYTHICAGIVIVIAWPKAFRNKLSGIWSLDFPCSWLLLTCRRVFLFPEICFVPLGLQASEVHGISAFSMQLLFCWLGPRTFQLKCRPQRQKLGKIRSTSRRSFSISLGYLLGQGLLPCKAFVPLFATERAGTVETCFRFSRPVCCPNLGWLPNHLHLASEHVFPISALVLNAPRPLTVGYCGCVRSECWITLDVGWRFYRLASINYDNFGVDRKWDVH